MRTLWVLLKSKNIFRALSLAGKKVLHIDQAKRYGGCQADFKLKDFVQFRNNSCNTLYNSIILVKTESNSNKNAMMRQFQFSDTSFFENLDHKQKISYSRKFTIQLMPLVLFSRSCSVDFLISSGCSNYLQFNTVNNNYFVHGSHIYKIPYSKSEIFLTNDLDLKEKHQLSKVISNCMHFANKSQDQVNINSTHTYDKDTTVNNKEQQLYEKLKDKPIRQYFKQLGVKSKIVDLLLYAIAFVNQNQQQDQTTSDKITTLDFFKRMAKYLKSIGYFGDSPMIMSQYGSSQYLQAFSRLSAVFGGMFVISDQVKIQNLKCQQDKCVSLQLKGLQKEPTTADQFFISRQYQYLLSTMDIQQEPYIMSHMILFSRQKLIQDLKSIGMIVIAPMHEQLKNQHPITVLQQSSWSNNMPDGEYLLHCSMLKSRKDLNNNQVFERLRNNLFRCFKTFQDNSTLENKQSQLSQQSQQIKQQAKSQKSPIFFYCTYNQHKYKEAQIDKLPKNLFLVQCSDYELDLDTDLMISQNIYYKAMGQNTEHLFLERKKEQQQQQDMQEEIPSEDNAIDFLLNQLNDI